MQANGKQPKCHKVIRWLCVCFNYMCKTFVKQTNTNSKYKILTIKSEHSPVYQSPWTVQNNNWSFETQTHGPSTWNNPKRKFKISLNEIRVMKFRSHLWHSFLLFGGKAGLLTQPKIRTRIDQHEAQQCHKPELKWKIVAYLGSIGKAVAKTTVTNVFQVLKEGNFLKYSTIIVVESSRKNEMHAWLELVKHEVFNIPLWNKPSGNLLPERQQ